MTGQFVLLQSPPEWGLPSSDARCNVAQALLRMSGKAYDVVDGSDTARENKGRLPVLKAGKDVVLREDLPAYFKKEYGMNQGLTKEQEADICAYTALVEKLDDALSYYAWVNEENYNSVTRPTMASQFPFPLSLYLPRFTKTRIRSMLIRRGINSPETAEATAQQCLRALSDRLGNNKYFFGSTPSTLDATVWGHIVTHYFCPYPDEALRKMIESHGNICSFLQHMRLDLFGAERPPPAPVKASWTPADQYREQQERWEKNPLDPFGTSAKPKKQRSEKEKNFRRRAKIFVATGVVSVLAYALFSDAIQLSLDDLD